MEKLGIEKSYASALIDVAIEANKVAEITEDFEALAVVMRDNPELLKLLGSPTVSKADKHDVIQKTFAGKIDEALENFLMIIADYNRFSIWNNIVKAYNTILDERDGVVHGIAYTVKPLGKETLLRLEKVVGKQLDMKVNLENRVDTSIVGGFIVYIDGKVIDASFKKELEDMKQFIMNSNRKERR